MDWRSRTRGPTHVRAAALHTSLEMRCVDVASATGAQSHWHRGVLLYVFSRLCGRCVLVDRGKQEGCWLVVATWCCLAPGLLGSGA